MEVILTYLRQFHFPSVFVRLSLALITGGIIGYGRSQKQRNAGIRTYMLTCVGSSLTVIISLYEYDMLCNLWSDRVAEIGLKFDGTRPAAAVVSGIGFLAAGTILNVKHQQVSGLTTAIGLFGTACLGLAAGAGFYEVVIPATILIIIAMEAMQPMEIHYKRRLRNITIYAEMDSVMDIETIRNAIVAEHARVFEIDLDPVGEGNNGFPSAILSLRLGKDAASHSSMLSTLAELSCIHFVRELVS